MQKVTQQHGSRAKPIWRRQQKNRQEDGDNDRRKCAQCGSVRVYVKVYIIRGVTVNSLLGRPVALAMGLVQRVYEVSSNEPEFGLLKTQPMKTVLQETAWPYAVYTARRVPFPLLSAWMEANNIVETVAEPTEW